MGGSENLSSPLVCACAPPRLPSPHLQWPLKGGKFSNWDGGVRVNALVSGGFVPAARRGVVEESFIEVADWFPTFCAIAGVDPFDARAAAAGLPPVEGYNLWPLLSGVNATSPRTEVVIGNSDTGSQACCNTTVQGLIDVASGWKLLRGFLLTSAWTGPQFPNTTGVSPDNFNLTCKPACLFNILTDPSASGAVL